jgi:hypothetical protein
MPNGERYLERPEHPQETLCRYRVPELDGVVESLS